MTQDIPLRCDCGAFSGSVREVAPDIGNHVVCYCDDCQAFAHFLDRPAELLDAAGGSDIFQVSPARVSIDEGLEHLACVRLSSRGLFRWYAGCCNTPVGNTLATGALPFVGLLRRALRVGDGEAEAVLGPVRERVFARYARGPKEGLAASDRASLAAGLKLVGLILRGRLRGDHKRSPYFQEGRPRVEPRVLTHEERAHLREACLAWPAS